TSQQEIISTPEAKGMRLLPSVRGISINLSKITTRNESVETQTRRNRVGQLEKDLNPAQLKAEACRSPGAVRPLELLQADPHVADFLTPNQSWRLPSDFAGMDEPNSVPSNCSIAAGPSHLVVTLNSSLAVIEKSGRQLLRCNLYDLFHQLTGEAIVFSPKVIYDQSQSRWALAACAFNIDRYHCWFLLAYSCSGDPSGDWWIWALNAGVNGGIHTGHMADWLGLSIDSNFLYLTANQFGGQGQFLYSKLRVLNRKELQTGGILHGWDFWDLRNVDGTSASCLQPAINLRPAGL